MTDKEGLPIHQDPDGPLIGASRIDPKLNRQLKRDRTRAANQLVRDGRMLIEFLTTPEQRIGGKSMGKKLK